MRGVKAKAGAGGVAAFVLGGAIALSAARAEEGMWPVDAFPAAAVEAAYGFKPGKAWLDHVRLSSLRLGGGCSAAFVSCRGLVQTNHHCAETCIQDLSSSGKDHLASGFYAREFADEIRCPGLDVEQLLEISDVTGRMRAALEGKEGAAFAEAEKAETAAMARECAAGDAATRCDVVSLYRGGVYNLYKYRRHKDVRLVLAPEQSVAFFGGDPDNFQFPRYDFDVTYLRVYENGKPLDSAPFHFQYANRDPRPDDLTFTAGHPGRTARQNTVAELEELRDRELPAKLFRLSELRGQLTAFAAGGAEPARVSRARLFRVENTLKALKGQFAALIDPVILRTHAAAEAELRARVEADPDMKAAYGGAWDGVRATLEGFRDWRDRYAVIAGDRGVSSTLFKHAQALVRQPVETAKPDEQRLEEYTDANLPLIRQSLLAATPIPPELEKLELTFALTWLREALGADDPFVKKALGRKSPAGLAAELVDGTRLADVAERARLLEGGQVAIDASADPMIVFARSLDDDMRAMRKQYEERVAAPLTRYSAQIAQARFKVYGTSIYPDATGSLRLSYGTIKGWREKGADVAPFTRTAGLFERATGAEPYALPESWLAAQPLLKPDQPFDFVTTNDVVGGNSGSPMFNKAGEQVGLVFDGNIHSLGGHFGYDGESNRTIAVSVGLLREALIKVYHADRIVEELTK